MDTLVRYTISKNFDEESENIKHQLKDLFEDTEFLRLIDDHSVVEEIDSDNLDDTRKKILDKISFVNTDTEDDYLFDSLRERNFEQVANHIVSLHERINCCVSGYESFDEHVRSSENLFVESFKNNVVRSLIYVERNAGLGYESNMDIRMKILELIGCEEKWDDDRFFCLLYNACHNTDLETVIKE